MMSRFSAWDSFCLVTRVWILDILLPLARKGVELTTIVYFWYTDHYYWGLLTTSAILLPGILEVKNNRYVLVSKSSSHAR